MRKVRISTNASLIAWLLYLAIIAALVYGWIMNIVALAGSNFSDLNGILVLRIAGIFVAPLGTVMGYI